MKKKKEFQKFKLTVTDEKNSKKTPQQQQQQQQKTNKHEGV